MQSLGRILLTFLLSFMVLFEAQGKHLPRTLNDESVASKETDESVAIDVEDPETTPGLYEGDIAIDTAMHSYLRVGLQWDVFQNRKWPNGIIPYVISPLYDSDDKITILSAIRTMNFMTCLKFVDWNRNDTDFLLIWPVRHPKGCWSYIGKTGGAQVVSLQPPDRNGLNCLGSEGRPIHELMHAVGVFHEQSRYDRDRFVKIHWENIIEGYKINFEKQSAKNATFNFEYDFNSVMHYGKSYFSKNKMPTMTPKVPGYKIGQRQTMSVLDCLKINDLYGCLEDESTRNKYYRICKTLGL